MIRQYLPRDFEAVKALLAETFPDNRPHNDPTNVLTRKAEVDNLMFVSEVDDSIAGFVIVGYDGHRGWIYSLAVNEELRGKGIGQALVNRAEDELRQLGCEKVNLQVRSDNAGVVEFYEDLGFSVEDRISMGKLI